MDNEQEQKEEEIDYSAFNAVDKDELAAYKPWLFQ